VQRGFRDEFLEFFSNVRESQAACGTARALGRRVVIEDVRTDPIFPKAGSGKDHDQSARACRAAYAPDRAQQ